MDALISTFVSQRKKQGYSNSLDETDGSNSTDHPGSLLLCENTYYNYCDVRLSVFFLFVVAGNRYRDGQFCKLSNKLSKLTLATLDDEGLYFFDLLSSLCFMVLLVAVIFFFFFITSPRMYVRQH